MIVGAWDSKGVALAVALAAVALAAGCGADADDDAGKPQAISAASEPPETFVDRTVRLVQTTDRVRDCGALAAVYARSYTRFRCPARDALRKSLRGLRIVGAKEYGTGAVVDYRSAAERGAILLFVAPDRNWGIARFGVLTPPSTDTSDRDSRAGYDKTVKSYLTGVRKRDCKAVVAVAFTAGNTNSKFCATTFSKGKNLVARLRANPDATPKYLGGNERFGFYGLELEKPKPTNVTISVVKGDGGVYAVMDAAPSPTAAELREVRRKFEDQQERREKSGSTGPKSSPPTTPGG